MARKYKNYMVIESGLELSPFDEWCVAVFHNYKKALKFCEHYVPRDAERLEIQGTDEPVDICTSIETLYIKDVNTAEILLDIYEGEQ